MKVKRQLTTIRLYYFIMLGATGMIMPFISLFFERQGLSGTQIGLLGTVGSGAALVAAPLWGRWSDRVPDPRRPLQLAFIGSAVVYLLISRQDQFVWLAFLVALNAVLTSGTDPMSDAITLEMLKDQPKTGFGSVRLWGSLGWAVFVLFSGWLIERTSIISAFWGYAVLVLATVFVIGLLDFSERRKGGESSSEAPSPEGLSSGEPTRLREMFTLVRRDRALVGLALAMGVVWLTRTGIYQFQAIYLDQLGAGESLIGLASTIGALVELPAMLWADHLIRRYGSHRVLGVTMLLYAVMHGFVVVYPSIGAIMAASALGGVTFSFYSVGIVIFLSERAPLGQTATILALYTSTLRGLISMAAAPVAGMVFDLAGPYWLYVAGLAGSLLGALVFRVFITGRRSQTLT